MLKSFLKNITDNKEWILIILGSILILFAFFNLINFNPLMIIQRMREVPAVEQEGFTPLFIPETSDVGEEGTELEGENVYIPERIVIDAIDLDAPVKSAETLEVTIDGQKVIQFLIPEDYAGGWHEGSAPLGMIGNTIISGHHNAFGEVFTDLETLETGDEVIVVSGSTEFHYIIVNKMILPERDEPLETRLENARWILPSEDERLTLVTCWPSNSNTHRLILVATPFGTQQISSKNLEDSTDPIQLDRPLTDILTAGTATPSPLDQVFFVRNTSRYSVNIRDLPNLDGEIIGSIKKGDEAEGLGRSVDGDWIYVDHNTIKGWVSAELVQILSTVESLPTIGLPTATP